MKPGYILLLWGLVAVCRAASPPKDWWAIHPIDRAALAAAPAGVDVFMGESLGKQRLTPSSPASRQTLIRRATMDLTGLPPSPAEVEAFVNDPSPEAYPRLIERLLASPHYGEQWARHWLDVARYSDFKGYVYAREEKRFVHASAYRDWVVRALNEDLGYDRFLLRQIAADQVEPAGSPHLAAMGFLTLGRRFLGVTHDIIDDRIDVVMRGTMGLTVGCARCHDHKFDPIPTSDYYALYGVFKNCAEKLVPCSEAATDAAFNKELQVRLRKLKDTMELRREEQAARVRATVQDHLLAQFELEKYPEEAFSQIIEAKDLNPFVVRRWQNYLEHCRTQHEPVFLAWHAFQQIRATDFTTQSAIVAARLQESGANPLVARLFATPPASMREVAERYGVLFRDIETQWQALRKATPSVRALPDVADEALRQVLHGEGSPCEVPDEHIANNEMFFPTGVVTELWKLQGEVDRWLIDKPGAPGYATILEDRARPVTSRIFLRGNPLTKGAEVPRGFLTALSNGHPRTFTEGSGRLELARAIIDPANPLTARVMVNRVWMHHFGQGLVATPSDFGTRASLPSHPKLLDWLALQFIDSGWSLKTLHRLIMLSATYQQSSQGPPDKADLALNRERDPDNRFLWRMNAHRLSFEEARDAWLSAAGHLDLRVGGRPAELFASGNTRRTLYATVDREQLPSVMRTFDFANPDLSTPKRTETTVPQQALFGMNHPFLAAQARALRHRPDFSACASDAERVNLIFRLLLQRSPTPSEAASALAFVRRSGGEEDPPLAQETAKAWQYGYGEWDDHAGQIKTFTPLPHLGDNAWQGGEHWPDVKLGWAQLSPQGGHPGNDRRHAVVRRWTAPAEGLYSVTSTVKHEPSVGDGIRAFIGSSSKGQLRAATVHASQAMMNVEELPMKAGDTLDFVVDIGGRLNSNQFLWAPSIRLAGSAGSGGDLGTRLWNAQADFTKSPVSQLDPWEQFVQVMMLANEFLFVD